MNIQLPGGMTWSHADVATTAEIVECFNALTYDEITSYNWRTAPAEKQGRWNVTDETYINGVMLTMDFDYVMGYLIQAVDRTSGQCTYLAVVQYHGQRPDGSIEHDWCAHGGTRRFGDPDANVHHTEVCHWAVTQIVAMYEAWTEAKSQ